MTALESRTLDDAGERAFAFTSGHIEFRQSRRGEWLTDGGEIGFLKWRADPTVFASRARLWNAR